MSDQKKGAMVAMWLGLLFMAAGLLTMLVSIRIPHYTADITGITDTYTTRQLTGGRLETTLQRIRYRELYGQ